MGCILFDRRIESPSPDHLREPVSAGECFLPWPKNPFEAQAQHLREPISDHGVGITFYDILLLVDTG